MRYKLVIECDYFGPLSTQQKTYSQEFPVELDTTNGPQLKDDPDAFFDHHFPRDNEQMFLNNADRQRFIKLYDQNMDKDFITDWYYKEEA